jgi:arylsulfatase A-like enzyme
MGEHGGNYNQQRGLYEEQIRVPLLIYGEGMTWAPAVVTTPCSQLDLMPTLMDILNIKAVNHGMGSSLWRVRTEPKAFFHNPYMYRFFGMRKGKYKCIYMKNLDEAQLFDLEADPDELCNIAHAHPELVAEMVKDVKDYEKGMQYCYERKRITPISEKQKKLIFPLETIS